MSLNHLAEWPRQMPVHAISVIDVKVSFEGGRTIIADFDHGDRFSELEFDDVCIGKLEEYGR